MKHEEFKIGEEFQCGGHLADNRYWKPRDCGHPD